MLPFSTHRHTDFVDTDHVHAYQVSDTPYTYLNGYSLPGGGRQTEQMYGSALTDLCKETRGNMYRLRETLSNVDPCYQFGIEHWHFNKDPPEPQVELPENMRPKWSETNSMFTTRNVMDRTKWNRPHSGDTNTDKPGPVNKFCYICTTLEEHQQHLVRRGRQLKEKEVPRPRTEFIVPVPKSRKMVETSDGKHDTLYRVTVKTGNRQDAQTTAKVMIRLKGKAGTMKPQQLTKKTCVNFTFGRGTVETFYLKTPKLGTLKSLIISHDGLQRKHSWYLEEVEVFDVAAKQLYMFRCRRWLSIYEGDHTIEVELKARAVEKKEEEYEIRVTTGNKTLSGTDANVTLTLCGKIGYSTRVKLNRRSKNGCTLERGKTDSFNIVTADIGALQKIRIEHDNTGRSPDWFLEKIEVEGGEEGRALLFPCGRWIPNDDEQDRSKVTVDLYPIKSLTMLRKLTKYDETKGPQCRYQVTVVTGDKFGAGTDANVYIVFIGKKGTSSDVKLDDAKNNFERAMVDLFKVKADDVGVLKKIKIKHDNTSLAAGWFLDKIIVKKFFNDEEKAGRIHEDDMEDDEKALKRAAELTGRKMSGRYLDQKDQKKSKKKGHYKDSDDDDSDEDEYTQMKKGRTREKDRLKDRPKSAKYGDRNRYDDSDSDNNKKKKKNKKDKKYGLNDSSDSDSDDKKKKKKKDEDKKKKWRSKGVKSVSEDSSDSDDDKKKKDKKKKATFTLFSDSDSDNSKKKKGKKSLKSLRKEDSDSDDIKKKKKKEKKGGKKKFSYGGIDTWVTESDSDSDSDDGRKSKKKDRRKNKTGEDEVDGYRHSNRKPKDKRRSKYKNSSDESSSSESDSDSDSDSDHKRKKKSRQGNIEKGRRYKGQESTDSEEEREYKGRIYKTMGANREPLYDEYEFTCNRWLATDEDDGRIERILKPESITTFYKKV